MTGLVSLVYYSGKGQSTRLNLEIEAQLEKIKLTQNLVTTLNSRTQFIQSRLLQDTKPVAPGDWLSYTDYDKSYERIRYDMAELLSGEEQYIMSSIDKLNQQTSELIQQVSVLFLSGSRQEATQIMLEGVIPRSRPLLIQLDEILKLQQNKAFQLIQSSSQTIAANQAQFVRYAILSIITSLIVALLAVFYGNRLSNRLSNQLEELNFYLEGRIQERTESLIEDNYELSRMASTDNLTGLYNRSYMSVLLRTEYSRFERHNQRFGIIMLDIDHFKNVNDNYGHDVGDRVLIQLANLFKPAIRIADYVGRWGGEEFLICCTTLESGDIRPIAETIRQMISNAKFDVIGNLTVSLGCAVIEPGETINELIKRADIALYEAKNNGRNQTVVSSQNVRNILSAGQ